MGSTLGSLITMRAIEVQYSYSRNVQGLEGDSVLTGLGCGVCRV